MQATPINARLRTEKGSRACRKLRRSGEVPVNLYGVETGKTEAVNRALAVSAYDLTQILDRHASVLSVKCDGREDLVQVVEVQRDALGDNLLHVDLQLIDPNKPMQATVGIVIKGEAKGTRTGGNLEHVLHSVEIEALPRNMPTEVVVRVDDLDVGQVLHVSDLVLPEGVRALSNPQQLVVHVVEQVEQAEAAEAPEAGAAAEPEVISKGKKDEEAGS